MITSATIPLYDGLRPKTLTKSIIAYTRATGRPPDTMLVTTGTGAWLISAKLPGGTDYDAARYGLIAAATLAEIHRHYADLLARETLYITFNGVAPGG